MATNCAEKELELSFKNRYKGMTFRDCFRIFGTVNRSSVAPALTEKIASKFSHELESVSHPMIIFGSPTVLNI